MSFSKNLLQELSPYHLLKHPFYLAWTEGSLPMENLKLYARQYYHHVAAFPRYISATHSGCEDISTRQVLLENLTDEEKGEKNHPELWLQFSDGLKQDRLQVKGEELLPTTKSLIDTFMKVSRSSFAEGLGALFAYEYQVPEVATSKIQGLKKHYDIHDSKSLEFFEVHKAADIYHSEAVEVILNGLSDEDKIKAHDGAITAAKSLWTFLDGVA
jgi:pyrroloquinoline-quinone synthase